jgi:16S rRNA (uracil1498-N3)-methyltransferase
MINSRTIRNGFAAFEGDLFNHIVRVLRLGTGEQVILVDEHGNEHQGVVDQIDRDWVVIKVIKISTMPEVPSSQPLLTICQALPKGDKVDLVLQKGTELGAHDFILFGGRRSVARVREGQQDGKLERWNRITTEASRQSRRRTIPRVSWFKSAREVAEASQQSLRLLLWEDEAVRSLKKVINHKTTPDSVIVVIGPEGGFDPEEIQIFTGHGFIPVTLGQNILRTETAAIAITAILSHHWSEF